MKRIEAIIQPFKLDDVKAALQSLGVQGLTNGIRSKILPGAQSILATKELNPGT